MGRTYHKTKKKSKHFLKVWAWQFWALLVVVAKSLKKYLNIQNIKYCGRGNMGQQTCVCYFSSNGYNNFKANPTLKVLHLLIFDSQKKKPTFHQQSNNILLLE